MDGRGRKIALAGLPPVFLRSSHIHGIQVCFARMVGKVSRQDRRGDLARSTVGIVEIQDFGAAVRGREGQGRSVRREQGNGRRLHPDQRRPVEICKHLRVGKCIVCFKGHLARRKPPVEKMDGHRLIAHHGGVAIVRVEFPGGVIANFLQGDHLQDEVAFLRFHLGALPLQRLYILLQLRIQFLPYRIRHSKFRCNSRSGRAPRSISPNSLLRGAFRFCGTGNGRSRFCGTGNSRSCFCGASYGWSRFCGK